MSQLPDCTFKAGNSNCDEAVTPAENARIVELVIERAVYDAQKEKVYIAFRPSEIDDPPNE